MIQIGCICGGALEAFLVIVCGGVLVKWLKDIIHRWRCKCRCHNHKCVEEGEYWKKDKAKTSGQPVVGAVEEMTEKQATDKDVEPPVTK
jgi:hypothetical protein